MSPFANHHRMFWRRAIVAIASLAVSVALPLEAQDQAPAITARGQVLTAAGNPVPRATVELLDAAGRAERTTRSDESGRFSLAAPGAGRFRLRATSIGYLPSVVDIDLSTGAEGSVNITLQEAPSVLSQVVVSATRSGQELAKVPASVSVVSQDVIQGTGRRNTSIEEVLRTVPGVVIRDQLGGASRATIAIRGAGSSNAFGVRSIRLLIDGIPKNNAGGSGQDLANLDISSISSIEVLRGPASTLYGNQAGGVVAMTTRLAVRHAASCRFSAAAMDSQECMRKLPARLSTVR